MDERLRDLERQYSRDPGLRHSYAVALNRAGEYTRLHDLVLDQLVEDTDRLNTYFRHNTLGDLSLWVNGPQIAHRFYWGPPPPPNAAALLRFQDAEHYYTSEIGDWGVVPHSELAMHSRIAGKRVNRYYLFGTPGGYLNQAIVELDDSQSSWHVGLPGEVLPDEVRRSLGGLGRERFPSNTGFFVLAVLPIMRDFARAAPPGETHAEARRAIEEGLSPLSFHHVADAQLFYYPAQNVLYFRIPWVGNSALTRRMLVTAIVGALPSAIYLGARSFEGDRLSD